MSEIANSEGASETEKPVQPKSEDITFPPFPEPTDADFEDDISEEEREFYKNKFKDLNAIKMFRLHCTACDRHLGCSTRNESRMRVHPMLRTLVCHTCHTFYNSGEFDKGDDGSELYCRWCGQGGQVYCCSDCPHVFCAKCIKRNLGAPMIKQIENADDWKCFKCNPKCLWDIRAICWAVLRYCDIRNKTTYHTQDPELRELYEKDCATDHTECCKNKINRRQKVDSSKKKEPKKESDAKIAATIISKMPSTIQVKKFASISLDESVKCEKKAQKRSASPKQKNFFIKNPIAISPCPPRLISPANVPPLVKKMRLPVTPLISIRPQDRKPPVTYPRIRPRPHIINTGFNGLNNVTGVFNNVVNDNINLSLESLTQGLDMSAVAAMSTSQDDDVVCTPDFPLEPMCEVTEDNDDDVQCITPGPIATPKISNPPPLVSTALPKPMSTDMPSENIIQMTENDVTVNAATGGLKFRVDPQTLSSNKMYRLPDGRIFAINANPNMPGGYSATIVAVAEAAGKQIPKGATYAAKLSAVSTSTSTPKPTRPPVTSGRVLNSNTKRSVLKPSKASKPAGARECDLNVPVEWYRYNLIDAVDALEYALSRLQKLKKEATTMYLRSRTVNEMRSLHRTLERLLNTSAYRFHEIRDNINKEIKQYVTKKTNHNKSDEDDDDDVEILPDLDDADDPIFIDENSVESNMNGGENQEVDLTGVGSEHNDSAENKMDNSLLTCDENIDNDNEPTDGHQSPERNDDSPENRINEDVTLTKHEGGSPKDSDGDEDVSLKNEDSCTLKSDDDPLKIQDSQDLQNHESDSLKNEKVVKLQNNEPTTEKSNEPLKFIACTLKCKSVEDINGDIGVKNKCSENNDGDIDMEKKNVDDKADSQVDCDEKNQDSEMSEEMIENLLKDTLDENATNSNSMDIPEELHET